MFEKIRNAPLALAVAASAMIATGPAFAGDLADAITAEITTAKAELLLVGAAVLTIAGVLLLIRSVKRGAGG